MFDPSSSEEIYSDPVDQLHGIQEVAEETAEANDSDAGGIFNEVSNEFYDF